ARLFGGHDLHEVWLGRWRGAERMDPGALRLCGRGGHDRRPVPRDDSGHPVVDQRHSGCCWYFDAGCILLLSARRQDPLADRRRSDCTTWRSRSGLSRRVIVLVKCKADGRITSAVRYYFNTLLLRQAANRFSSAMARGKRMLFSRWTCRCRSSSNSSSLANETRYVLHACSGGV